MATVPATMVLLLARAHAIIPLGVAVGSLVGDEEELVTEKVWASRAAMVGQPPSMTAMVSRACRPRPIWILQEHDDVDACRGFKRRSRRSPCRP